MSGLRIPASDAMVCVRCGLYYLARLRNCPRCPPATPGLAQDRAEDKTRVCRPEVQSVSRGTATIPTERELQRDVECLLRARGVEFLHLSPRAREKRGWPDLVFAIAGRACAIELKAPRGRLSADQESCRAGMERDGWKWAQCRSVKEVQERIEEWRA